MHTQEISIQVPSPVALRAPCEGTSMKISCVWVFRSALSASINVAFHLRPYESPYNSSG